MTEESNQYQIVADLLARQDSVLLQLDELSSRIDAAIKEIAGDRESLGGGVDEADRVEQVNNVEQLNQAEQMDEVKVAPLKRAA